MNKKGFTLVELLAVIVILAIVMLVAVTSIGPLMTQTRQSALGSEGLALIKAATSAYNAEIMKGTSADFKSTDSICMTLDRLNAEGYYEKSSADGYTGSVLIDYDIDTKEYTYRYWITNGVYAYLGASDNEVDPNNSYEYTDDMADAIVTCGIKPIINTGTTQILSAGGDPVPSATTDVKSNYIICNENCYPPVEGTPDPYCISGYKLVNGACYKEATCENGTRSGNTCTYDYTKSDYCVSGIRINDECYSTTSTYCSGNYSIYNGTCRSNATTSLICPGSTTLINSGCYSITGKVCPNGYSSRGSSMCVKTGGTKLTTKVCPSGYVQYTSTSCRSSSQSGTAYCPSGYSKYGTTCRSTATTSLLCPTGYTQYNPYSCRKQIGTIVYGCASGGDSTGSTTCRKIYDACTNYDSVNDVCLEDTKEVKYKYICPEGYTSSDTNCVYKG